MGNTKNDTISIGYINDNAKTAKVYHITFSYIVYVQRSRDKIFAVLQLFLKSQIFFSENFLMQATGLDENFLMQPQKFFCEYS